MISVISFFNVYCSIFYRYTYGKPVIGTVKLYADIDYSNTPWKNHGDEVMVEAAFDVCFYLFI
jgi:hypothetical protein